MKQPVCNAQKTCGGCALLNMNYTNQLKLKQDMVKKALKSIHAEVEPCVGMFYPYAYRNKVHFAVQKQNNKINIGFFEEGGNRVVAVNSCVLFGDWIKTLHEIILQFVLKNKIEPYNKQTKYGTLKYVVARQLGNSIMVTLVVRNTNFSGLKFLYAALCGKFKDVSLYLNVNKRTDNLVLDENGFVYKFGNRGISHQMLGVNFELLPSAFFQVNEEITIKIYKEIVNYLKQCNVNLVLDLFSGIGITGLCFAKLNLNVVCIEQNKQAVETCKQAIKMNNIKNVVAIQGKCELEIEKINLFEMAKKFKITNNQILPAVFLDPPRAGADEAVLNKIKEFNAKNIVYLSCNPETLARDLKILQSKYIIEQVIPYDMFPQTNHVETLVFLKLKSNLLEK